MPKTLLQKDSGNRAEGNEADLRPQNRHLTIKRELVLLDLFMYTLHTELLKSITHIGFVHLSLTFNLPIVPHHLKTILLFRISVNLS